MTYIGIYSLLSLTYGSRERLTDSLTLLRVRWGSAPDNVDTRICFHTHSYWYSTILTWEFMSTPFFPPLPINSASWHVSTLKKSTTLSLSFDNQSYLFVAVLMDCLFLSPPLQNFTHSPLTNLYKIKPTETSQVHLHSRLYSMNSTDILAHLQPIKSHTYLVLCYSSSLLSISVK